MLASANRLACQPGPVRAFSPPNFRLQWRRLHSGPAPWLKTGVEASLPLDFKLDFDAGLGPREQVANALRTASIVLQGSEPNQRSNFWTTLVNDDKRTRLTVAFSPHHVVHPWSARFLVDYHPYTASKVRDLLRKSVSEPLWWHVMVYHVSSVPSKFSVVVNYAIRRKIRKAFIEALHRKGYDEAGRKLVAGADSGQHAGLGVDDYLYGSVRLGGKSGHFLVLQHDQLVAFFVNALERQVIGRLKGACQRDLPRPSEGKAQNKMAKKGKARPASGKQAKK